MTGRLEPPGSGWRNGCGLTYGKTLGEACRIGTRLASAVIATRENVTPRFLPAEFGLPEVRPR